MEIEGIADGGTKKITLKVIVNAMTVENGVRDVFDFSVAGKDMELGGAIKSLSYNGYDWWIFDPTLLEIKDES